MENNLPKGWIECSIGEILISRKGKKPSSTITEPKEGYLPYILIDEMEGKTVRAYTNDNSVPLVNKKDVLLVWDGSIGKCGSGLEGVIGSTLVALTPLGGIPTKFLEYTIRNVNPFIKETSTGTGLQHINKDFFKECIIPLPPLPEQQRIVEKLDALMARISNSKARLEKIPAILKNFRQSVLAAAVSGELTNSDYSIWNESILGNVILDKPKNGYSAKPVNYKTGYRILTLTATTSGIFKPDYFKYFDERIDKESQFWLRPNDILVQRGNTIEYVGVPAIYDGKPYEFIYPDLMMRLRADENNIVTKFLYFVLSSEESRNFLRERATGTAGNMPKINQPTLISLPIKYPSVEEQKKIVRKVEELFHFANSIEARYRNAKAWFDKLPQSILAKAFRGELVSQNESDEPASELLKRIQNEKHSITKTPKPAALKTKAKKYRIDEDEGLSMVAEG